MTGEPGHNHGPIIRFLRNGWVVLSTLVVVVLAGILIYAVLGLDRFFEEEYVPPTHDADSTQSMPGAYAADSVRELCDELDMKLIEETVHRDPQQTSTNAMCLLTSFEKAGEIDEFGLRIEATVWDTVEEADANFEGAENGIEVDGPWDVAITFTSSTDLTTRSLVVMDQNLAIRITQYTRPPDSISDEDSLILMTTYAEQTLDAYRQ